MAKRATFTVRAKRGLLTPFGGKIMNEEFAKVLKKNVGPVIKAQAEAVVANWSAESKPKFQVFIGVGKKGQSVTVRPKGTTTQKDRWDMVDSVGRKAGKKNKSALQKLHKGSKTKPGNPPKFGLKGRKLLGVSYRQVKWGKIKPRKFGDKIIGESILKKGKIRGSFLENELDKAYRRVARRIKKSRMVKVKG